MNPPHRNFDDEAKPPFDQDGNGTHIASTIVSDRYGIAPEAKIINIRLIEKLTHRRQNSNRELGSTLKRLSKAIRYAADSGANIINLSFTKKISNISLYMKEIENLHGSLKYAENKGSLIVASAGDKGAVDKLLAFSEMDKKESDTSFDAIFPIIANIDLLLKESREHGPIKNMIVVCAVDESNLLAGFSNYSATRVHLCAPGVGIEGANFKHSKSNKDHAQTILRDGTSVATSIVTGVAALIWSANKKELDAKKVIRYILSASKISSPMYFNLKNSSSTGSVINAYDVMSLYLLENASFLGNQ